MNRNPNASTLVPHSGKSQGLTKRHPRTYSTYHNMLSRCNEPSHKSYPSYGGRSITVCPDWVESFAKFMADMGERPLGKTLDRIDPNGNYEVGNCRWATDKEQHRNKTNNRKLTLYGYCFCVTEWAELLGISAYAIYKRLQKGWSDEDALLAPVRYRSPSLAVS